MYYAAKCKINWIYKSVMYPLYMQSSDYATTQANN